MLDLNYIVTFLHSWLINTADYNVSITKAIAVITHQSSAVNVSTYGTKENKHPK